MKKLNETDWFFILAVFVLVAVVIGASYAIAEIITAVIRWGF